MPTPQTLSPGEPHPSAGRAMQWINESYSLLDLMKVRESLASTAIEGNRLAEICVETLRRLLDGESVSDRYLLGLAWLLRELHDDEKV